MDTVKLLEIMDELTDNVNGPGRIDVPKRKGCNVTTNSHHHTYWREMRKKMEDWVSVRKTQQALTTMSWRFYGQSERAQLGLAKTSKVKFQCHEA